MLQATTYNCLVEYKIQFPGNDLNNTDLTTIFFAIAKIFECWNDFTQTR